MQLILSNLLQDFAHVHVGRNGGAISKATAKRLNQVPVVRSPSITSSHLNAVAPLVRINRLNSDADSFARVQVTAVSTTTTTSRVTSIVPPPKGTYRSSSSAFRGLRVFSDRKEVVVEPKKLSPPPPPTGDFVVPGVQKRTARHSTPPSKASTEPAVVYAQPKSSSRAERLEEQRQRRELRKRGTGTNTVRARPATIFDSLTKRR